MDNHVDSLPPVPINCFALYGHVLQSYSGILKRYFSRARTKHQSLFVARTLIDFTEIANLILAEDLEMLRACTAMIPDENSRRDVDAAIVEITDARKALAVATFNLDALMVQLGFAMPPGDA